MSYNKILYEYDLPHRAITVYMYLRERYNAKTGLCFPSVSTIAGALSLSKRTVFRALTDLENADFIKESRVQEATAREAAINTGC